MKRMFLSLLLLISVSVSSSLEIPLLRGRVNDYAGILTSSQHSELEDMLNQAEISTSSQIVLLTIPSLQDEVLEEYSLKVAETWELGQKEYDNGLLLLIALEEKKIRIEVGYGLEAIITDIKSGYIIRNLIVPEFKKGNFYRGIYNGLTAASGLITQDFEISEEELAKYKEDVKNNTEGKQFPIGFIIFWIMFFLIGFGSKRKGGLLPLLFLGSALGGSSRGSGFSGFGGGGFSGGGGSFGGGGASGGW